MREKRLHGLLAFLVLLGTAGCKTMPSLTWWKTASKAEAPDATAIAHGAPVLPSEVALQQEAVATAPSASTVAAAPYVSTGGAAVSPAGYPSTTAPAFNASASALTSPSQIAAAVTEPAGGANVSSIAMPYNPNVVPPAPQSNTAVAQNVTSADRYASMASAPTATTPSYSTAPSYSSTETSTNSVSAAGSDLGSRYAASASSTPVSPVATQPEVPSYAAATEPSAPATNNVPSLGDRYASQTPSASLEASTESQPATQQPTTVPMYPASQQNLAGSEPYRPGGTSSYPGTDTGQPTYNVATRPEETASQSTSEQGVPNVTTPEPTTETPTQRYW